MRRAERDHAELTRHALELADQLEDGAGLPTRRRAAMTGELAEIEALKAMACDRAEQARSLAVQRAGWAAVDAVRVLLDVQPHRHAVHLGLTDDGRWQAHGGGDEPRCVAAQRFIGRLLDALDGELISAALDPSGAGRVRLGREDVGL